MNDLHRLGIRALQAAFLSGELRPSRLVEEMLARIDGVDRDLHSFIEVDSSGARAAAAESDSRIRDPRPLEGIPIAIKSNIAVAGLGWSAGMEARSGIIATQDADAVARLRAAGAIILGTLNMHEAALGATSDNPWFGRVANPHAFDHTPGGSSGGGAAAVAAALCVGALGTDTLGSVRIPAAYTGIYGLKPTTGAVSATGVVPLSRRFDTVGPLARSLADLEAIAAALLAFGDPGDRAEVTSLVEFGGVTCEPAVLAAYARALDAAGGAAHSISLTAPAARIRTAAFIETARELRVALDPVPRSTLSRELLSLLDYADRTEPDPKLVAEARSEIRNALTGGHVLLLPTTPQVAFRHGARAPSNQADFAALANIAGLPALTLPAGRGSNGLPIGIQLVGSPGSESLLLALARKLDTRLGGFVAPPCF